MKQRNYVIALTFSSLTACVPTYSQYAAQPSAPTVGQIQSECFTRFQKFAEQTGCVNNIVRTNTVQMNGYGQEYLAYMQLMQEKVVKKALSESEARLKLAQKLNELSGYEKNEMAVQQQLDNQRAATNAEVLRVWGENMKQPELYLPITPNIPKSVNTTCYRTGNQVDCHTH